LQAESVFQARSRFTGLVLLSAHYWQLLPDATTLPLTRGGHSERQGNSGLDLERYYKANLRNNPHNPPRNRRASAADDSGQDDRDEILQQRAAKLNLTASDEDVNAKLTEIKGCIRKRNSTRSQAEQYDAGRL